MFLVFIMFVLNGLEPASGGSKFGDPGEQQIWKKQSGGLFRSNCISLESCPAYQKAIRYLLPDGFLLCLLLEVIICSNKIYLKLHLVIKSNLYQTKPDISLDK